MRAITILAAGGLALAGCESTSVTSDASPARLAAESVAEGLSSQVGVTEGGVGVKAVRVSGTSVITTFGLPTPGAGADEALKTALAQGITQSFGPQVCSESGIAALYAAGGDMVIRIEGADGVLIADVPADCA